MTKIVSIKNIAKLAKKPYWKEGFLTLGDKFIVADNVGKAAEIEADIYFQFNVYNPYRNNKEAKEQSFQFIQESEQPVLVWEEGCFRKFNQYKRLGWEHYQNNLGNFKNDNVDNYRWNKFAKENKLALKDWKLDGDNILILGQKERDSALIRMYDEGYGTYLDWLLKIIYEIRKNSDRPIVFRPHPFDVKKYKKLGNIFSDFEKIYISNNFSNNSSNISFGGEGLQKDLQNAKCTLAFNSNAGVDSILSGIPTFALDKTSPVYEASNTSLENIENINYNIDLANWANKIVYTVWNRNEIASGEAWSHLRFI